MFIVIIVKSILVFHSMDAISYLLLQSHKQIYKFDNQSTESVYNTYTIHIKQHIVLQNDQNKHCLLSPWNDIYKQFTNL
jgi:hypothetical protein